MRIGPPVGETGLRRTRLVRTRRRLLGSLPVLAGPAALAACGGPSLAPAAGPEPLESAALTYVNWFAAGSAQDALFRHQSARFQERYPQVSVEEVKRGPGTTMLEKVLSMAAAGTPPDLAAVNPQFVEPLRARGMLADLTAFVKRDARTFKPDDFYEATRQRAVRGDKWHAVPLQMGLWFTVYNRSLLEQAGVAVPTAAWTWDHALEAARAAKARLAGVLGIAFPPYELPVRDNGGDILSKDESKCLIGEPPAVEAIQWIGNLRVKHQVVPAPAETAGQTAPALFASGCYPFHVGDPGFLSSIQRVTPAFEWDIAEPPKGKAAQVSTVKGPSLVMWAETPHQEAAWAWLADYAGVEMQRYVAVEGKIVSARKSALDAFVQVDEGFNKRVLPRVAAMARPMPYVAKYDEIDREIGAARDAVYNGRAAASVAMREAARKVDLILHFS